MNPLLDVEFLLQRTLVQEQQVVRLAPVRNRLHVLASEANTDDQHRRTAEAIANVCFAALLKVRDHFGPRREAALAGLVVMPAEPRDALVRIEMIAALLVDTEDLYHNREHGLTGHAPGCHFRECSASSKIRTRYIPQGMAE